MLEEGKEFQDFCVTQFPIVLGITISLFTSRKYQYNYGESLQCFEFKYDKLYRDTGNIWIEMQEKTNSENREYKPSGILRNDNTQFWAIGDYRGVFIIPKKTLIVMSKKYTSIENNLKTSIGYLLPVKKAEDLFPYIGFSNEKTDKYEYT